MSPGVAALSTSARTSGLNHVDALLAKQSKADKVFLRRRIEFRRATRTDEKMDLLRKKYKPINETKQGRGEKNRRGGAGSAAEHAGGDKLATEINNGLVESSGFRQAAHSLFAEERLSSGWRTVRPIGPGLGNLGNTCFLNSVLQCLTYTPPFAEYLLSREHSNSCRVGDNCILCRFEGHVTRALSKREGSSISPKSIVGRLKIVAKHMRVGRQEDAHEFLRLLVESFQRSLMHGIDPKIDQRIQETTLAHHIFGGYLQSQVHCTHCGYDSNTFEPALDISLDIQAGSHITKALRSFVRTETLTRDNRYKCERCNKLVEATKQMTVYRLPRILTLQLKRFSALGGKINRYVEFPLTLDMKSYVSKNSTEREACVYSLYAVLVHSGGTVRSGHYYCFVKSPAGAWYELNDSMVHQVSERTVLKQSAYLLFYERRTSGQKPKLNIDKNDDERPAIHGSSQHAPSNGLKAETASDSKHKHSHIQSASNDMEELLQDSGATLSPEMSRREKKKNRKKIRKEARLAVETGREAIPSEDGTLVTKYLPAASVADVKAGAGRPTGFGLDEVTKELGRIMHQTAPSANNAKEGAAGKQGLDLQPVAEPETDNDHQPENKVLPSPWIVRSKSSDNSSKAQVIGWNENMASKRSKLAATKEALKDKTGDWSVAEARGNHMSQYGADVQSWAGRDSVADEASGAGRPRKKRLRRPDVYDTGYDRGRVKKVKKNRHDRFATGINPFQMLSELTFKGNKSK
ncbi:hypothetical protein GGH99_003624 [Coemansia sp. RSA 1285]|nr:hypothetical protein GGH99_003624 [Coemansia sp. RSA 1285]